MARSVDMLQLEVVFLPQAEGGRASTPSLKGGLYRPHLVVPPSDEMLGVEFVDGPDEPVVPGQPLSAVARLVYFGVSYVSLLPGTKFLIREGARTVGQGQVIDVLPPAA